MAIRKKTIVNRQGILPAGTIAIYTSPPGYTSIIQGFSFNSPTPNVLTVVINKLNPPSSVTAYSFTLAAGDVVTDAELYPLLPGESISVTTTAAATNFRFRGSTSSIFR